MALAGVEVQEENYRAAEQRYRHVLEQRPDMIAAARRAGSALMQLGRIDEAVALFEQSQGHRPDTGSRRADQRTSFSGGRGHPATAGTARPHTWHGRLGAYQPAVSARRRSGKNARTTTKRSRSQTKPTQPVAGCCATTRRPTASTAPASATPFPRRCTRTVRAAVTKPPCRCSSWACLALAPRSWSRSSPGTAGFMEPANWARFRA